MNKTKYFHIKDFETKLADLCDKKLDFSVAYTNYSRKIKLPNKTYMFNQDGKGDFNTLLLINKVRHDAKKYLEINKNIAKRQYVHYSDLVGPIDKEGVISKVDIKSAYWECARNMGVISKTTNNLYEDIVKEIYANSEVSNSRLHEKTKGLRTKALGSLSTQKRISFFVGGKRVGVDEIKIEPTRGLYIDICKNIDNVMRECSEAVDGCIYYYVDCMFVARDYEKDVIEFFKYKQFDCGALETRLEYLEIGKTSWLMSMKDGKMYAVPKESKHLLKEFNQK